MGSTLPGDSRLCPNMATPASKAGTATSFPAGAVREAGRRMQGREALPVPSPLQAGCEGITRGITTRLPLPAGNTAGSSARCRRDREGKMPGAALTVGVSGSASETPTY